MQRTSALVLLVLCLGQAACQLPPGVIPLPDTPTPGLTALTAAPTQTIAPAGTTSVAAPAALPAPTPAAAAAALPTAAPASFPVTAAGLPAAAPAGYPAATTAAMPALPATAATAAVPTAGVPVGQFSDPMAAAGFPTAAVPVAAAPIAPNPFAMPATAGYPTAGFPAAAVPGAAVPTAADTVIAVPPAGGAAALPGAMPAMDPLAGLAGASLPPGLLPGTVNQVMPAPPPRARPAAPPAPPIPTGASWKPQWDDLKDFTGSDVIASFNVANTMEQVFWNQKKVREALAKAGGVLPNAVSYYQVLPSADEYGRPFTTVRFVIQNRNAELADNLMSSLNDEKTQDNLKNRIEELNLDLIGDSMKAQTPTDFKASARGAALPSSTMMDSSTGLNGVATAGALSPTAGAGGAVGAMPLPGTAAAGGNASANSTAGLPGAPGGMAATLAERRRQSSSASSRLGSGVAVGLSLLVSAAVLL